MSDFTLRFPVGKAPGGAAGPGFAARFGDRLRSLRTKGWKIARYARFPRDIRLLREQIAQASREMMIATDPRYADPRHLCRAHGQVYSQNGEDGIIAEIFDRIGTESRTFIEIGVEQGLENNTRLLLETGWRGIWINFGDAEERFAREAFASYIASGALIFINARVDRDNIDGLLRKAGAAPVVDLLSVDIDANTHHVWRAIDCVRARVAVIEYNASYPPSVEYELPYKPDTMWDNSNRFGASLKSMEKIGAAKGMSLVSCDWNGVNAFFIDETLCADKFVGPFTSQAQYQPPRFSFEASLGHRPFVPHG